MLVLSRKTDEKVVIGGGITVTVLGVKGNRVRLGIEAPDRVPILREEIAFWQDAAEVVDRELDLDNEENEAHEAFTHS